MNENDLSEPAATDQPDQGVAVNRLAIAAVVGIASLVSFAPLILVPGIPLWVILGYIVVASVVALWAVDTTRFATYAPNALEWFLSSVGAVFLFVFVCLVGFLVYAALSLIASFGGLVLQWLGVSLTLNAQPIILGFVLILGVVASILVGLGSPSAVEGQLYPNEIGIRSPFYDISQRPKRLLEISIVALGVLGLLGWLVLRFSGVGTWLSIVTQLWLFTVSIGAFGAGLEKPTSHTTTEHRDAEQAVERLLKSLSYTVVPQPRTQDKAIDPYLKDVDLLAYNETQALAVKIATDTDQVEWWSIAGQLDIAAFATQEYLNRVKRSDLRPEPLLVLVGNENSAAESLSALPESASIRIVRLESADVDQILRAEDDLQLQKLAADALQPRSESAKTLYPPSPLGARDGGHR